MSYFLSNRSGTTGWPANLRTHLVLGRVSNLPTVWSNCLAGWLLGGAGTGWGRLMLLVAGASCLYLGGMFLNDAFDSEFDRQHRKSRPIPTGAIRTEEVWAWGVGWLGLGVLLLGMLGWSTLLLGLWLAGAIVLYDAVHKLIAFAPVLMAFCRFLLYLVASSAAVQGVTGLAIWNGLALGLYIIGLSYLARKESNVRALVRWWPCYLLAAPVLLALLVNVGEYRVRTLLLAGVFGGWVVYCLRYTFWSATRNIGRSVAGLLAGIVLVDLLAVAGASPPVALVFVVFFLMALLAQRYIPAT